MTASRESSEAGRRRLTGLSSTLAFATVVLALSLVVVVARRPPLTGPDVRRNASQLAELAAWTDLTTREPEATRQVTYTFDDRCGSVAGLALIEQWDRSGAMVRPETHLWFSLRRDETRWFRELSRQPLPSTVLLRNDLNSDLVAGTSPEALSLAIRPAGHGPLLGGLLSLDNQPAPAGQGLSRSSNRRLSSALASVHCHFEPQDLTLFSQLAKVARARIWSEEAGPARHHDAALTIYRHLRAGRYGIEVRVLGEELGVVRYTLEVTRNHDGARTARLRVHGTEATLDRSVSLYLIHPKPPGEMLAPGDPGFVELRYRPAGWQGAGTPAASSVEVDLAALLGSTSWRAPG